jgi:hypothetical protein
VLARHNAFHVQLGCAGRAYKMPWSRP